MYRNIHVFEAFFVDFSAENKEKPPFFGYNYLKNSGLIG
jgi:hypothetical protein